MPRLRPTLLGRVEESGSRDCGLCRLCSKLALHEIDEDVQHGVVTISRPPSYPMAEMQDLRPPASKGCLWARGLWGNGLNTRPDQTGVVPWVMRKPCRVGSIMLFVRPDRAGAWKKNATASLIRGAWMQGRHVYVRDGSGRDLCVKS
jgi:hypothetical protein